MEEDFSEANDENEEESEEILDPSNPEYAFNVLEKDFNQTVTQMEQDPNASQYADHYSKVFEQLYETHQKEKDWMDKCKELEEKLAQSAKELELAAKLARTDAETIEELKDQIQLTWKMADTAHHREQAAQEIIENMRKHNQELSAELELKNKLSEEDTEEMGQLNKKKESLQRERDKLLMEVEQLNLKLEESMSSEAEMQKKIAEQDVRLNEYTIKVDEQLGEIELHKKTKEKLDVEVADLQEQMSQKDALVHELNDLISSNQKQLSKVEALLKEHRITTEKMQREIDLSNSKYQKLSVENAHLRDNLNNVKKLNWKQLNEMKVMMEETRVLKNEISKHVRQKEMLDKTLKSIAIERDAVIMEREQLRQTLSSIERDMQDLKKTADTDKRQLDNCTREKEILTKNILRHQALAQDHLKLIKIQEQSKRKLENEIDEFKIENNKQKKQISYLERERDRLAEEELDLTNKIESLMDDIRYKKNEIYDLKKSLAELDSKMRMQQNLFEAIRADRNALQKSLQETTAEIGELKNKLKIGGHQNEQLKEDISMKEQLLMKAENILRKVTKEKENLIVELNGAQETIKILKQDVYELATEEKRLHKVILEGDRTIADQAKDLEQLMNERDILGSQLVRRNDEIALLYEKIRILQSTLHRGEAQYAQRVEDIRLLKIEIKRLRQEKNLLTKSINNMTDLRQEVFLLERDLTRERLKCRALEEELQHPLNIHRWRKLEGSDPEALDLLQKIQMLQKRLLQQAAQAVERERQLKEMEKLYLSLKQVVAKQPGAEIQSELTKTQRALAMRRNKMKCLVSELNMTEQQMAEYKVSLEKVTEELGQLKRKQLDEQRTKMKRQEIEQRPSLVANQKNSSSTQMKFAGGGFRMSTTSIENTVQTNK